MKIRFRYSVTGSFHGFDGGVERGEVVDVEDVHALRYVKFGMADRVGPVSSDKKLEAVEESAIIEPEVESAVVKRTTRGRPKKQPEWHDEQARGWKDASPES